MATTSSKTIPKDSSDRALRSRGAAFTSTSMSMEPGQHGFVLPEYRRLGIPKPRIDQNEKETREVSASAARNGSVRGRKTAHNFQVDHEEAAGLSQPGRSCSDANNHRLSRQQITEKLLPTQSSGLCHGQLYREASDKPMDMSAEIMLQNWGNRSSLPAKNNMSVVVSQEGTPSRMMTGKKCPAKLGQPSSKNGYMENISIAPGSDLLPEPSGPIAVSTAVASNTSGGCTHEPEAALSTCQREILPPCSSAVESRMRPDGWLLSTSCVGMSKTVGNMTPGLDGSHCRSARQETESASWSFLGSTLPVSTGNGKRHLSTFECRDHTTGCLCSELKPYQSETSQSPLPGMPLSQAHAVPPMRHAKTAADGWTEVISSNPQGGGCVSGFAFQGMYTRKGGVSSLQPRNALSPSGLPAEGEGGIRSWEFWRSGSWQGASCGGRDSVCASCQQLHQGDTKRALTPAFSAQSEPAHGAPVWPDSAGKGDNMPTPRSDAREPGGQVHTRVSQASDASEALTVPLSANPDHIALGRLSIGPHGRHVQTATRTVAASPSESQAFRQLSQGLADYKVTGFDRSSMREKGINAVNGLAHGAGSDQRNRVRASSNGPAGGAAAKISGSMYAGPEYACTEESCPPSRPGAFPSTAGAGNGNLAEISSRGLDSRTQLVSEANELEEHRILIDRGRALAEAVRDATQQALAPSPPSTPQKRLDFRFISPFESRVILGSASCSEAAASAAGIPPAGGGMMRPVHMMPPSASHERFPLASADMDVAEIISHASHVRLSESLSPYQPRESPYSLQQVEPLDLGEPVSDHREREAVRRQLEPDLYTPPPQTRGSNRLIQIPTPSTLQYSNAQKRPCSTTTPLIALPKSAISCGGFNCKEMATVLASQTSRCTPSTSVANTDSLSLPLVAYVPKQTSSAFSAALPTSPSPRMASSQRSLSSTPGPTVTELPIASLHSLDPLPRACKIPHEGAGKPVPNSVGPVAALVPYDFRSRQDAQSCARESETSGARHVDEDLEVPNKKMMPVVELHHRMGGQTNLKPYVSRAPQILLRGPETCSKGVESDGCAMEQLHDKTSMPEEVPSRLFDPATMICPSEQFPLQRTELGASSARQLHEDLRTAEEQPKPVLPDSSQPTLLVPYCSPPNQLALQTHGSMAHRNGQGSNAVPRACLPIESWQRGKEQAQPGSQQMDESSIAQDPDSSLHVHLHLNGGSAPWMVPPHRFSCSSSAAADSSSDGSQAAAADLETATGSQVSHNSEPSFPSSIAGDVSRLLWRLGGIID